MRFNCKTSFKRTQSTHTLTTMGKRSMKGGKSLLRRLGISKKAGRKIGRAIGKTAKAIAKDKRVKRVGRAALNKLEEKALAKISGMGSIKSMAMRIAKKEGKKLAKKGIKKLASKAAARVDRY